MLTQQLVPGAFHCLVQWWLIKFQWWLNEYRSQTHCEAFREEYTWHALEGNRR